MITAKGTMQTAVTTTRGVWSHAWFVHAAFGCRLQPAAFIGPDVYQIMSQYIFALNTDLLFIAAHVATYNVILAFSTG